MSSGLMLLPRFDGGEAVGVTVGAEVATKDDSSEDPQYDCVPAKAARTV